MPEGTDALNESERRILRLLAQGHTAKTIAVALDLSVGAVNERLRDARRKTRTASSRELARLLSTQENRNEQIGAAGAPAERDRSGRSALGPIVRRSLIAMGLLMTGGALAAVMLGQAGAGKADPVDAAAPKVVATSPRDGATIAPGPFALTVTFDRPMRADGYSFVTIDGAVFPSCAAGVTALPDGRSFAMACTAEAGARYGVGFNHGRFRNFRGHDGAVAVGRVIRFSVR